MQARCCPALFISAPGSNHGKTTVTAALARYHVLQGRKVKVFKAGPDFLDPMILERASGQPVYQLDLWMAGEAACKQLVYEAAQDADLILIEGVMGLFDGQPCSADLAEKLGVPVLAVIDAKGTAQTLGAIAYGLARYRSSIKFAGVLANGVASERHSEMIKQGMPPEIPFRAGLPRSDRFKLPERHLGLMQATEINDLDARISDAAALFASTALAKLPPAVEFSCPETVTSPKLLSGLRIGVARDNAFSFIYQANLDLLSAMGAELAFFSPLADQVLPDIDSLYLPGGYPELHLSQLQNNVAMKAALLAHFDQDKPIYAECGGMLYLLESLTDKNGSRAQMCGILPGQAVMQSRLQGLGYQVAPMPEGTLRAHTFHYSAIDTTLVVSSCGAPVFNTSQGEKIFRMKRLTASYLHCYFPSNPNAAAQLFKP